MSYRDERWYERAACIGQPLQVFFPDPGHNPTGAKDICASCPVTNECLREALKAEDGLGDACRAGVWGGKSAHDRSVEFGCRKPSVGAVTTSCPAGHEYTPDNTLLRKGGKLCKTCLDDRKKAGVKRTECSHGHDLNEGNVYRYQDRTICKECRKDSSRAYQLSVRGER